MHVPAHARSPRRAARRSCLLHLALCAVALLACGDDDGRPRDAGDEGGSGGSSAGEGGRGGRGGSGADVDGGGGGGGSGGAGGQDARPDSGTDPKPHEEEDAGSSEDLDAGDVTSDVEVTFDEMQQAIYATLSPLGDLPLDPTNDVADDARAAALGQKLFFDASYSGPLKETSDLGTVGESGKISCFSCHSGPYLDDQRSQPRTVSLGAGFHGRNAPTTINSAFYRWTNWGGRFSAPWELPIAVLENGVIMNGNRLRLAHVIFDKYKTEYEALFGALEPAIGSDAGRFPADGKPNSASPGAWEAMTDADRTIVNQILVNFGKVLEAYTRKLVSRDAPFDQFVAGEQDAIDDDAKRGLKVFMGRGRCVSCHLGPHFSDGLFHNIGVAQVGEKVPATDYGRFQDIPPLLNSAFNSASSWSDDATTGRLAGLTNPPPEDTRGQFRTPSLRGVALTAPYMHSGQIPSLEAVIDFYDAGGGPAASGTRSPLMVPLHLTAEEKSDLRAFLHSLTGKPVPSGLLVDTSTP